MRLFELLLLLSNLGLFALTVSLKKGRRRTPLFALSGIATLLLVIHGTVEGYRIQLLFPYYITILFLVISGYRYLKKTGLPKIPRFMLGSVYTAIAIMLVGTIRPHLVRRLILAGTGPQGGRDMHGWNNEINNHAYKDVQGAEDIFYLFFAPTTTSQRKGLEFVGRIFTRSEDRDEMPSLQVRDAQAKAIIDWGIPDLSKLARLAGIRQPTLVANGNHDIMVPTVNSYLLAGHIPNAELMIYPDANHGFLFQYPHEFAEKVNAFLNEEASNA